ncbi:major facilitator superfamily domain-containing protein [Catenaria anguillulae PL171]|uniref:Major facilitator superfamily domain-containing protein n=1 Tax=Catenaria anguillulae PL171 TaxID=765915 RepID=A0A1Y2HGW9_9FUNG|nr:major facilitator superfamily domain-containing protein [Catenaria anguillulae PL171]
MTSSSCPTRPALSAADLATIANPTRWRILAASCLIQLCLGTLYAFSVFNASLATRLSTTPDSISLAFFTHIALLGLSAALIAPRALARFGPRRPTLFGCVLFALAHVAAGLATSVPVLVSGFGVMGGIGTGLAYLIPVATTGRWFPDQRGFAAGVVVAGFGAGAVVGSFAGTALIGSVGVGNGFLVLGGVYACVQLPLAMVLEMPPNSAQPDADNKPEDTAAANNSTSTPSSVWADIKSPPFVLVYLTFLFGITSGLAMLSKIADMVKSIFGLSADSAAIIVAVNGLFNVAGRAGFGAISDKLGRSRVWMAVALTQCLGLGLVVASIETEVGSVGMFCAGVWILTSAYGASFGLLPGILGDLFGAVRSSPLYGAALTAWSLAGVLGGSVFNTLVHDARDAGKPARQLYTHNFYWLVPMAGMALVATLGLDPIPDRYSISDALGKVYTCYSLHYQALSYYRYGQRADCSAKWDHFKFCIKIKTKPQDEMKRLVDEREAMLAKQEKEKPSSLSVWELRDKPPANFPPELEDWSVLPVVDQSK